MGAVVVGSVLPVCAQVGPAGQIAQVNVRLDCLLGAGWSEADGSAGVELFGDPFKVIEFF